MSEVFEGPSTVPAPRPPATDPAPRAGRELDLMGEFIGARLKVEHAPGWRPLPWEGTVVGETKNTFQVVPAAGGPERILAKRGLEGTLLYEGQAIRFKGDELRHRPEDRIKRLAPKGRTRRP